MGKSLKGTELGKGIIQRKNGRYEGRYVDVYGNRVSIYDDNLNRLKDKLRKAKKENCGNRQKSSPVTNNGKRTRGWTLSDYEESSKQDITLNEWYDIWISVHKYGIIRPSTQLLYTNIYNSHIRDRIGNMKLCDINSTAVKNLLNKMMDEGLSDATISYCKRVLNDMMGKAELDNRISKNPCRGIRLQHKVKDERRILTREEQAEFFDTCSGTFYNNLFVVAVNTGMRVGELCALTWDDVDFDKGFITVNKTLTYMKLAGEDRKLFHIGPPKTAKSNRKIPISEACSKALKKQYMQHNIVMAKSASKPLEGFEKLLFTTKYGTPLNDSILSDAIARIVDEINTMRDDADKFMPISMHTFRHTFATRCLEAGITPRTIQQYLGHASIEMTMNLYVHITDNVSLEEIKLLDQLSNEMDEDKAIAISQKYDTFKRKELEKAHKITVLANRRNGVKMA